MATHGEKRWPPTGRFDGRLWGAFHGHRHRSRESAGRNDIATLLRTHMLVKSQATRSTIMTAPKPPWSGRRPPSGEISPDEYANLWESWAGAGADCKCLPQARCKSVASIEKGGVRHRGLDDGPRASAVSPNGSLAKPPTARSFRALRSSGQAATGSSRHVPATSSPGEARSSWQHDIPPTKSLRYSITFRTLRRRDSCG